MKYSSDCLNRGADGEEVRDSAGGWRSEDNCCLRGGHSRNPQKSKCDNLGMHYGVGFRKTMDQ